MARGLLLLAMCAAFPHAQTRVILQRRVQTVLVAHGTTDHAPEHDWRRPAGGATRALFGSRVSFENLSTPPVNLLAGTAATPVCTPGLGDYTPRARAVSAAPPSSPPLRI